MSLSSSGGSLEQSKEQMQKGNYSIRKTGPVPFWSERVKARRGTFPSQVGALLCGVESKFESLQSRAFYVDLSMLMIDFQDFSYSQFHQS